VVLIALGSIFLLDQFEFIPDFDFEKLWPVVLVAVGAVCYLQVKRKPWEKEDWHAANRKLAEIKTPRLIKRMGKQTINQ
jgi:phage shock protein C